MFVSQFSTKLCNQFIFSSTFNAPYTYRKIRYDGYYSTFLEFGLANKHGCMPLCISVNRYAANFPEPPCSAGISNLCFGRCFAARSKPDQLGRYVTPTLLCTKKKYVRRRRSTFDKLASSCVAVRVLILQCAFHIVCHAQPPWTLAAFIREEDRSQFVAFKGATISVHWHVAVASQHAPTLPPGVCACQALFACLCFSLTSRIGGRRTEDPTGAWEFS